VKKWLTCRRPPSGSATSPTTSPDHSSRPAASDPNYTVDCDEPVFTASGGGRAAAAAVQGAANQIATQLDVVPTVKDVAPLAAPDVLGTNLLFLLTYSSIGAYLLIVILTLIIPKASFAVKYASVALASVVLPLLVFGLSSIFVGDYNASFQEIIGVLLIDALYVFTVGSLSILLQNMVGQAAIFLLMGLIVFINLPSSGGPMPVSMLPPFWQFIHNSWMGSAMIEWIRGITYFDGAQIGRWSAQLLIWGAAAVVVLVIVVVLQSRRRPIAARVSSTTTVDAADPASREPQSCRFPEEHPTESRCPCASLEHRVAERSGRLTGAPRIQSLSSNRSLDPELSTLGGWGICG
jgi:hypothetical protein